MTDRDWFAILREELQDKPSDATMSPDEIETLVADIISGRMPPPKVRRSQRSRKRWIAGGAVVVLFAGGATAAALWNRSKPEKLEQGIACHGSLDLVGDAEVIPPAVDPLEACKQLWFSGHLPDIVHTGPATDVAPPLFACVGIGGGLDVFPNMSDPPTTCGDLGLVEADTDVSQEPLVLLNDHLANDINLTCVNLATAQRLTASALSDVGLSGWTVSVRGSVPNCAMAVADSDAKTIFLQSLPRPPTTT